MKKIISQLWGLFIFLVNELAKKLIIIYQVFLCVASAYFFEKGNYENGLLALFFMSLMIFLDWAFVEPKSTKGK